MTKKDHIKFAKMIQERREHVQKTPVTDCKMDCHLNELDCIVSEIADLFADDNPNFDRDRFLKACGVE